MDDRTSESGAPEGFGAGAVEPDDTALQPPPGAEHYSLPERVRLTIRHHGGRELLYRVLTFPLRFTPLRRYSRNLGHRPRLQRAARAWYREHGRPVSIVVPSFRDTAQVRALVRSLRKTTDRHLVSIIVADDASGPEHVGALRAIDGVTVVAGDTNQGFAANVNRGIRAADPTHDVVLLNSDMVALPGWLEGLQYAAAQSEDVGLVGGKLLYERGSIQWGGTVRHRDSPEWFDHRFRFRQTSYGPANIPQTVLALTGACMYIKREVIDRIGLMDEGYDMAFEDVDFCLRARQAGYRSLYWPGAELEHLESVTRGRSFGEREKASQRRFWSRWGAFFDERDVRTDDGRLRVVYVTEDTGVGGGHRDIFEHLNRLHARGHEAELWTLADPPAWFELDVPVRSFADYEQLVAALAPVEAIKIATWWNTAGPVWEASFEHGIPVYFVQDIETSYYPKDEAMQDAVLASYRHEFSYMTISSWNRNKLRQLGLEAELIPPGIDLDMFRPRREVARREDMVLALGRSNPLKNLPLTLEAWRRLPEPRPELCLFGIEPQLASEPGIRYVEGPTDGEVARLLSEATVFVQTSYHEGFCLPPLESMATGGPVVCTDAHGNRDFCRDGENCLMPEADVCAVSDALARLLSDSALRERLGEAGIATAALYAWERRIDALERFLESVAAGRRIARDPEHNDERPEPSPR
jgi:GT2 family glycosyltransferase